MYRVLIPVDTNEQRARKQTETIDSLPPIGDEVEVHVLHVYEEIDMPADEAGPAPIEQINESLDELREIPESVRQVIKELKSMEIEPIVHEKVGEPAETILSTARDLDADVILMGVRDRTPIGKVVFGSVSQKVFLECDTPILVAR
ncbi:universal stress protein [Halodesulfurarchaeum sp.]|uniref:universal stress protein n=1 Tax=Halodesulfurarchaeum sp. TaxID=1980530 RepID=UPI002FC2FCFA